MIVLLPIVALVGIVAGWVSDTGIMGLGTHGFLLGLLGVLLCALTMVAASWINVAATLRRTFGLGWSVLASLASGFLVGAPAALGWYLGADAIGVTWLGVLFAIVLVAVVCVGSAVFLNRIAAESAQAAREREYHSRPLIMDFDEQGRGRVYKRPW